MDEIDLAYDFLIAHGCDRDEFAFAASAGLQALSKTARTQHKPVMLDRPIHDVDVLILPERFEKLTTSLLITHDLGISDCANIYLGGPIKIELTRCWPVALSKMMTQKDLQAMTIDTPSGRVLDPCLIAALKLKRREPKDLRDLQQIERAHRCSSFIHCLP